MQRALGEHIFPRYVELKRREWDEYRIQVTRVGEGRYLSSLCTAPRSGDPHERIPAAADPPPSARADP